MARVSKVTAFHLETWLSGQKNTGNWGNKEYDTVAKRNISQSKILMFVAEFIVISIAQYLRIYIILSQFPSTK